MIYKVLMYGDRKWSHYRPVKREMKRLIRKHGVRDLVIIEGGAVGADQMARAVAEELSVHFCHVPALWETRHQGAGPQRNAIMSALEPDEAICFHENIKKSKGSKDMMKRLEKDHGLQSKLVTK